MDDTDHPLSHLSEVERDLERKPEPVEIPTQHRLRAFENKALGEDHLRHNHQVEKGIGSPFSNLSPAHKAHHAALEKEHAEAETHMAGVHAKLEAAVARAADTEEAL